MKLFDKKDRRDKGMEVINRHIGKKLAYLTFLKTNPTLAEKYLEFLSKNSNATYIYWDKQRQCFIG